MITESFGRRLFDIIQRNYVYAEKIFYGKTMPHFYCKSSAYKRLSAKNRWPGFGSQNDNLHHNTK